MARPSRGSDAAVPRPDRASAAASAGGADPVGVHPTGSVLTVVVAPRAGKTGFERLEPESVRVRVAAPPVQGAANDALLKFLAEAIDVPRSRVRIVSGTSGRRKRVLFAGLDPAELRRRLAARVKPAASGGPGG